MSFKVTVNGAIRYATYDFLLVFHCYYICPYIAPLTRYHHLFPKIERGHVTEHIPFGGNISCMPSSTPVRVSILAHEV